MLRWLRNLLGSILNLQVIVVLYSPPLLPESIYKYKAHFEKYIFETKPGESNEMLKFNVKRMDAGTHVGHGFVKTMLRPFTDFTSLKTLIGLMMRTDKVYTIYTNRIELRVRMDKFIAHGSASVNIIHFLRSFVVHCDIRHEVPTLEECCSQNMLPRDVCHGTDVLNT